MQTFDTPEAIAVSVELGLGQVHVAASDRADTIVEVRPSDPAKNGDVAAAEQARIEYANGRLLVRGPKGWRQWVSTRGDSIDVRMEVPEGSQVRGQAGAAALRCSGRVGECRFKTGVGDIQLEEAGPVSLRTGAGDVSVDRIAGRADVSAGSGTVAIGVIEGPAVVKNSNGDTWIGDVVGDARVHAANGRITIDAARGTVAAKTANGDVRLGEVVRGVAVAESGFGAVEVGVRDGAAAWLDLETRFGNVHNELEASGAPASGQDAVEIHARTSYGDVSIRRSTARPVGGERG